MIRLGRDLQLLVGAGEVEIARRGPTGSTLRPKVVVAELKGCDPLLWRPEHPAWMRVLEARASRDAPAGGNGQPPDDDAGAEPAPPASKDS